jgi:hypothetical protein
VYQEREAELMTIELGPELEAALKEAAEKKGVTPEALVRRMLWQHFPPKLEPRDEWERELFALATDCGVSLSDEALSRENMYD